MLGNLLIFFAGLVCGLGAALLWYGMRFLADLRATQQRDVIAAPEHNADLEQLAKVLEAAGCTTTMQPAEGSVRIETAGLSAADLNRLAASNGITLRQLAEQTRSLERAFFALTGTDDAGVGPGQEMGAIK